MLNSVDTKTTSRVDNSEEKKKPLTKSEQNRLKWYDYFVNLAEEKGGEVVSDKYERMHAKMTFKCEHGHVFSAKCHDVHQKGSWCPTCAGNKRLTAEDCQAAAEKRNGEFLSKDYLGLDLDHTWCCSEGHVFNHTPLNVMHNDSWCPICTKAENKKAYRLKKYEEVKQLAADHGGLVVSKLYITSRLPMSFQCAKGHSFTKTAAKVRSGEWCPMCKVEELDSNDSYEDE
ncbi:hypothetical protein HUO09_17330 [Vibrio sp. Y2-5]|uniref:hypothetical protein n=1 Tax=Vibrio sp. Y2-5 TaxID=2743977 RepID=UPI0016616437|nr:hypothetical protein [Vibrio sp. Y2-5]MBD0788119.1 hypothetical protein [Vibrio sp. Y2-5]